MKLSPEQKALIADIKNCKRYCVARFELRSSRESEIVSTALDFVRIEDIHDTMETVKSRGALLRKMCEEGLLRVCLRLPVSARSDYQVYYDSDLFAQLNELVREGREKPGFLFDTAAIKRGVVTVTQKGREAYLAQD